jgi:hypothetical protein
LVAGHSRTSSALWDEIRGRISLRPGTPALVEEKTLAEGELAHNFASPLMSRPDGKGSPNPWCSTEPL